MRIAVAYDCLFPWSKGGGERLYRTFAEEFAAGGHEVTYLTRRQWDGEPPQVEGMTWIDRAENAGGEIGSPDAVARYRDPEEFEKLAPGFVHELDRTRLVKNSDRRGHGIEHCRYQSLRFFDGPQRELDCHVSFRPRSSFAIPRRA